MDRVKGWFWKSSSSEDDKGLSNKSQEIQPVLNKTSTQDNKDVTSEITNENNSSLEQFKTVPVKPVIVEDVSKAPLRYRLLTSIKTKAQNASDKLAPWFEKNTHLQPEDCLMCKLSLTSCVTLLYISSLFWTSNHRHSYKTKRFGILMYTVGCFGSKYNNCILAAASNLTRVGSIHEQVKNKLLFKIKRFHVKCVTLLFIDRFKKTGHT